MASRVEGLADAYGRHVGLPWDRGLAPPQRVWFAIYPKEEECRLRYRVDAFQLATANAGKRWVLVDLTDSFSRWINEDPDRDLLFADPDALAPLMDEFVDFAAGEVVTAAAEAGADDDTLVAVLGVAALFGFAHVSDLVPRVVPRVAGRLLVFFPGSREGNVYKLLDAREGWNYLATPITAFDDGSTP